MRAMVSPALPALTVLTASIERLGQSCARAAGAKVIRTAHATAPHHVRNDIDTSLECGRSSDRLRSRVGLRMMPPIGARTQPAARPLRARVAVRWVKHFQATHHSSVDVAHGLALLFGLGTKALPSWDSKTRWNNLRGGLAVDVMAGSSRHTNSPHPSSREGRRT